MHRTYLLQSFPRNLTYVIALGEQDSHPKALRCDALSYLGGSSNMISSWNLAACEDSLYMHIHPSPIAALPVGIQLLSKSLWPFHKPVSWMCQSSIKIKSRKAYMAPWTWSEATRESGRLTFWPTRTAEQGRMSGEDIMDVKVTLREYRSQMWQ